MRYRARSYACFVLLCLTLLVLATFQSTGAPTLADKSVLLSGMTNLGPFNTITHPFQVGFLPDEQLITATNTLLRPYLLDLSPEAETNLTNNNNLCENTNDSYAPQVSGWEPGGMAEVYGMWVTWDSKNLYGAVGCYVQGKKDNLMLVFDTAGDAYGTYDFPSLNDWTRKLKFTDWKPDFFLGLYADYNDTGSSAWFPDLQHGIATVGHRCGHQWHFINSAGNQLETGVGLAFDPSVGAYTNDNKPWAGYTGKGATDTDRADNIVFFKVPWSILTNRAKETFVGLTNWKIKFSATTTGPDNGYPIYDWLPDSRYSVEKSSKLGIDSRQNNYFEIQVTDGTGNFRYPADLRADANIRFYPGSYKDLANDDRGQLPFWPVDSSGLQVKGLAPHLTAQVYFRLLLKFNTISNCNLKVYDIKGNVVRTIFSGKTFEVPFGTKDLLFNDNPGVAATADLSWDGRTNNGEVAPMGIYFIVFKGEDGTVEFTRKLPFMILK